jgi:thiosulfate/3-mercaptopyruvate sulfurtransferase
MLNDDGMFKSNDELKKVFEAAHVDLSRPTICMCGSGLTGCVPLLALSMASPSTLLKLYDGSYTEWGLSGKPIERP